MVKYRRMSRAEVRNLVFTILRRGFAILLMAAILAYAVYSSRSRVRLDYNQHLSETAVVVDGEEMTLGDLYFYVLYEEKLVEDAAGIYNERRTKDFWNAHVNGIFIQTNAKKAVMDMAVHDRIFYRAALERGLALTSEEKQLLENARTDFWADLYDEQKDDLPVSYESVNSVMAQIALAEKYEKLYANENNLTLASLAWDGYDYEVLLKEHDVRINKSLWKRVIIGDVSLVHEKVGFINGYFPDEDKE